MTVMRIRTVTEPNSGAKIEPAVPVESTLDQDFPKLTRTKYEESPKTKTTLKSLRQTGLRKRQQAHLLRMAKDVRMTNGHF